MIGETTYTMIFRKGEEFKSKYAFVDSGNVMFDIHATYASGFDPTFGLLLCHSIEIKRPSIIATSGSGRVVFSIS